MKSLPPLGQLAEFEHVREIWHDLEAMSSMG